MNIAKVTPRGKLGKGKYITLTRVAHGATGVSTRKGMSVTLTGYDENEEGYYITISAAEFLLMREWFAKNGCEE